MRILQTITKPQKITLPGKPPQTVKLELATYKIVNDNDAKELHEVFASGVEIVSVINVKDASYVTIRKAHTLKIALGD